MTIFQHVEVRVLANRTPLPEYPVPPGEINHDDYSKRPNIPQLHKYLECTPGTHFEIDFKTTPDFQFKEADFLGADIYLDGKVVDWPLFDKIWHQDPLYKRVSRGAVACTNGIWTVQKYRFAELTMGADDSAQREIRRDELVSVGTIKVLLDRKIRIRRKTQHDRAILDFGEVKPTEKSLKGCGKDTCAALDASQPSSKEDWYETTYCDKEPLAIIVFHCFSKDALQKIGVIERPPSPMPLEKRSRSTLTREEALDLLERNEADQEEIAKVLKHKLARAEKELAEMKKRSQDSVEDGDNELQIVKKPKREADEDIEVVELSD